MAGTNHTTEGAATPQIVALNDIEALQAGGAKYPETVDGWRWLYRVRRERGMEKAFLRVGRRILVDIPAYLAAVREQAS